MTDPFLHDDAAYVLGSLSDAERTAFEEHLVTCADCRARVAELAPTAQLLASVPRNLDPPAPMPETLLAGLLRRAARERRRRRTFVAAVAAVAAACAVALAVVAWPSGDSGSGPATAAVRTMQAVRPNPLKVTAQLVAKQWGTQIRLRCSYPSYDHERFAYDLVVVDRGHRAHVAGDWTLVPGQDAIVFTTGTAVARSDIERLQIRTSTGTPLLELRV
jgi:hypothetical protein